MLTGNRKPAAHDSVKQPNQDHERSRLALNTAVQLAGAMYSRLTTQANARPGELQLIIADNELPDSYRGGRTQIDFDYDRPTVSTIEHPGPARVSPISTVELEDV
jgi:hypothetical protein